MILSTSQNIRKKGETMKKAHFENIGVRHATINRHRFHLITNGQDGHGHLWIDGRQPPLILDNVATAFVSHLIDAMWQYQSGDGDQSEQVINYVVEKMYETFGSPFAIGSKRVTKKRIRKDLHRIFGLLISIADGTCPNDLGISSKEIQYDKWNAPARMDLALTYRCNLRCTKCYLGDPSSEELTTSSWKMTLDALWEIGVPQVVFTGGEPTLRQDLVELVSHADKFVTGLITNGTRLADIAEDLASASLDYVQVTIESFIPEVHDKMTQIPGSHTLTVEGIKAAVKAGLQVVTNTTLTKSNYGSFLVTMKWLKEELGVCDIACNTLICSGRGTGLKEEEGLSEEDLIGLLNAANKLANVMGINLQWYSPTCYSSLNPINLGFGMKQCSAAAHNMTIQPDGSVIPCQSWPDSVGNILTDDWNSIWNHPTCLKLRNREFKPSECSGCTFESSCGGGCPLDKSPRKASKGGAK